MSEVEKPAVRLLRRNGGRLQSDLQPIVLEYKKRKKKRKERRDADHGEPRAEKYSPGLEDVQRLEGDAIRIANRATRALSKGIDTYDHERKRSAKEKKDGAVEDFVYNYAKAASETMKEASELPVDLAEAVNKRAYRKRVRSGLKRASKLLRTWRI